MDLKKIESKLETMDGFKAIYTGLFGGGKAKQSYGIYSNAIKKGVYENSVLRTETFDGSVYAIMVFSIGEALDNETKESSTKQINNIPLGTIRYECLSYAKLELWRGGTNSFASKNNMIAGIMPEGSPIFVYPVTGKKENLDCPAVIYAYKDNQHYIYPLPAKAINRLI